MDLEPRLRKQIQEALYEAFKGGGFMDAMLYAESIDVRRYVGPNMQPVDAIRRVIQEAEQRDLVREVLAAARQENPTNQKLELAEIEFDRWDRGRNQTVSRNFASDGARTVVAAESQRRSGATWEGVRTDVPAVPSSHETQKPDPGLSAAGGPIFLGLRQADWNSIWARVWNDSTSLLDAIRDQMWRQFAETRALAPPTQPGPRRDDDRPGASRPPSATASQQQRAFQGLRSQVRRQR